MKTHYFILLNAVSLVCLAQKSEEDAIKKIIEQESISYVQKDFDAWSKTWAHDTAAFHFTAATTGRTELRGWNAIATTYKRYIDNLPVLDESAIASLFTNTGHQIFINGNTAIVTFKQGTTSSSSITKSLVKQNGEWKILNTTVINNKSYALAETIRMLRNLVGIWEVEPGTIKATPAESREYKTMRFEIKETPNGFESVMTAVYNTSNGNSISAQPTAEYFIPDYSELEMAYMLVTKNQNGQTYPVMGTLTSNSDGSFTVRGVWAGKPTATRVEYTSSQKDGKCHRINYWYAVDGKKTQTYEYYMHRVTSTEKNAF